MARASEGNEQLLCSFCGKSPAAGQEADRWSRRLHLRRVHRSLQRDHRRGAHVSGAARPRQPPEAARHLLGPERLRRLAGGVEAHARGGGLQPLQARAHGPRGRRRGRAPEVEHPPARPDGLRQDAARADARAHPQRPVRDRRRHRAHRGRLRRRGRREHPAEADPGRRLRHQEGRDRDHLHRRGRQDRAEGGQPVDHARRLGRGRAAGAAQDPRGHGRLGAAAGRPQAPAPGVPLDRHDEHPLHLRRRVRRASTRSSSAASGRTRSASAPTCARATPRRARSSSPRSCPRT